MTSLLSFSRTRLRSPTIGTSTGTFLPISDGSMSTWIFLEPRAKALGLPVIRSSKRIPRAMSRSASSIALLA